MLTVDAIFWCILWFVLPYGVINVINNNNSSCSVRRLTLVVLRCGFWSLNFAPTTDELQYILPESERRRVRGVYAGLWVLLLFFTTAWSRDVTAAAHTFSLRSLPALAESFAGGRGGYDIRDVLPSQSLGSVLRNQTSGNNLSSSGTETQPDPRKISRRWRESAIVLSPAIVASVEWAGV